MVAADVFGQCRDVTIRELTSFKTTAVSRLAAQHAEIEKLRAASDQLAQVRMLPTRSSAHSK
jgi:hypothetical protein